MKNDGECHIGVRSLAASLKQPGRSCVFSWLKTPLSSWPLRQFESRKSPHLINFYMCVWVAGTISHRDCRVPDIQKVFIIFRGGGSLSDTRALAQMQVSLLHPLNRSAL